MFQRNWIDKVSEIMGMLFISLATLALAGVMAVGGIVACGKIRQEQKDCRWQYIITRPNGGEVVCNFKYHEGGKMVFKNCSDEYEYVDPKSYRPIEVCGEV
jgi:hypothetical protein